MTTIAPSATARVAGRSAEIDNRGVYLSFGLAYVLGHGTSALARGTDPLIAVPTWLSFGLLGAGFAAGTVFSIRAAAPSLRAADKSTALSGKLLGLSWISAFTALFLAITGLAAMVDMPDLQTRLWPAGSGLVVGLLYLGEGAVRRNLLHYCLGTWLALVSGLALFLETPGLFWLMTIAGGGGYAVATVLEHRRLRVTR
ncbi:ABC transporter permease [Amycolatopsis sp. NPDC059027]|uniref:ABC transporter permease n=1 Tax=unclassified Amycolatopsis TaxID=2618356 RepID=UPI00366CC280